jgi:hypothetical protein
MSLPLFAPKPWPCHGMPFRSASYVSTMRMWSRQRTGRVTGCQHLLEADLWNGTASLHTSPRYWMILV